MVDDTRLRSLQRRGLISPDVADQMTHWPDPAAEEVSRRLGQVGQNLWNRWGAPIKAAKALGEAATSGTLNVTDPETAGQAFDLVSGLAGTGTAFAEPGAAGIFGGALAKGANRNQLAAAKEMEARGSSAEDIYRYTGWFQGKDNQWRFEIPDKGARWIKEPSWNLTNGTTLKDVLDHPELYQRYPYLADMPIMRMRPSRFDWSGMYNPPGADRFGERLQINRSDPASPRSIVLHEIQHAIQEHEGFDPGGMPDVDLSRFSQLDPRLRKAAEDEVYRRGAGETEARQVERRQNFSQSQRQQYLPWNADVPLDQQLLATPGQSDSEIGRALIDYLQSRGLHDEAAELLRAP